MKRFYLMAIFMALFSPTFAGPKYWIGSLNGNWSDQSNWSDSQDGSGGAAVPGLQDSVIFNYSSEVQLVHIDLSPTIGALKFNVNGRVTFYASSPIVFTILKNFAIDRGAILKDSTSTDVPFNLVFNGTTQARARVYGTWIFEGGIVVNRLAGNGATFTAEPGSQVLVGQDGGEQFAECTIRYKKNTNFISSNSSTLQFRFYSKYILEDNLDASIPNATWYAGTSENFYLVQAWAAIFIYGRMDKLEHMSAAPEYRGITIDLPAQSADASLDLPDGTMIDNIIDIVNTNNKTLTLLSTAGPNSSVNVELRGQQNLTCCELRLNGTININENSKVALAKATSAAPATSYRLSVRSFNQKGGNFSLQDYNNASGSSTLSITKSLDQTGGTFFTNSSTLNPSAKFTVEMDGPQFYGSRGGVDFEYYILQTIKMSAGTIDNGNKMVTLRVAQTYNESWPGKNDLAGVTLLSPLEVGRLELVRGSVNTTATNTLTVVNPDPVTAVTVDTTGKSYIFGPLRRWTNSIDSYLLPTGTGNHFKAPIFKACVIIPSSTLPSLYQAEYFNTAYSDLNVSAPLKGVSTSEYWNITKISGTDASLKLVVNKAVPGAAAVDAVVAARYTGCQWQAENGTVLTPGSISTGSVTTKSLSSFGPITFGYGNPVDFSQAPSGGLNYKYYEGFFPVLPDFSALTPVKTGNSANVNLGVRRPGVNDSFAIVWDGYINIPTSGSYSFETISDDGSKLYFNGQELVNNDGTHPPQSVTGTVNIPAAGQYPIRISFFENYGGEGLQVYWTGPGMGRQQISDAAFASDAIQSPVGGLNYKYYEGFFPVLPDFSSLTPVKTGNSANVDLGVRRTGINDSFAIVWDGYINIPTSGDYRFETISDDGSKLYFNGQELVNNDGTHPPQSVTGTVNIPAAGKYPIRISFFENYGGEGLQVYWTGPGMEKQLITDAAFANNAIQPAAGGLNYKYYEGYFPVLPDFSTLTPVKTGKSANVNLGVRSGGVNDSFAIVWDGLINIPTAGSYTFQTASDDGSKLYFNGQELVNNDGTHPLQYREGTVNVPAPGKYPITISYFENYGGEGLSVFWSGPGIPTKNIPDAAFAEGLDPVNGLNYRYYEGDFDRMPDFSTLTPTKAGKTTNIDIGIRPAGVNDHLRSYGKATSTYPRKAPIFLKRYQTMAANST